MTQKKIAIVLSGCGVYDGSEIHEAVMCMYAVQKTGNLYEIFAPDINQMHVVNHLTGEETGESRNVLVESARIARGNIKNIKEYKAENFNGLLFPGGFGAAKNLSDYATMGDKMNVLPELEDVIKATVALKKVIGALCISPVIMAKLFPDINLTIGSDEGTIKHLESMKAVHHVTDHGQIIEDNKYNVITTPCYMLDANIVQIQQGAENVVNAMLKRM